MHDRATLPNGIRVLTERMPHVRSATVIFYFGVGSRYEDEPLAGVSHFIEHMLFKGSERYPTAQTISETIEGLGGVMDAATGKELTAYSAKIASRHFDLAMDVLTDMVRHPILDPHELEKERRVITEEINMYRDSPQDWVWVLGDEALWPGLPLGREVAGTRESVEAITREGMDAYRRSHYLPNNLVVGVTGDIEHERVVGSVERLLGGWEAGESPRWMPCPPPAGVPRVRLERRDTEQTNLCLFTPGVAYDDSRHYALSVLNTILGEGMSSRLFLEVRERQGLAYEVNSSNSTYHDTGCFTVYAGVEPSRTGPALRAILAEMGRMRTELVPEAELGRAKEYIKGRIVLGLEDTYSVAAWLAGQELRYGRIHEVDEELAHFDAVTAEDLRRLASDLFQDEWLRLALIGPHDDAGDLDGILAL
jgi:predicted Zn-dependent peptidase